MFSALQPMLRQKLLNAARQRQIAKIERARGSRVILVVHRQETMSFLGFPVLRYIDINDSEEILRAIHMTDPRVAVDFVLHTPGRSGARGPADRSGDPQTTRQGDGVRAALRDVGRHADRARRRRDRHE
jgi:hypothetical protein